MLAHETQECMIRSNARKDKFHDEKGQCKVPFHLPNGCIMHVDVLADVIGLNNLSLPAVSEASIVLIISSDGVWGEIYDQTRE